ncbi:MAG: YbaK/EbsC family protein [Acidimicrobiia bacterium]|nr:YbaK/EbsC family protein [Acidimicrobiia bacterium]MDH3396731.1 YbaK/EbsC family protein [Acidimicrobiia bacterium]
MELDAHRVRKYLISHGVGYKVEHHPPAFTAQEVAAAEHVPGRSFAKPVIVNADGRLIMMVLPANRLLDLDKVKAILGSEDVRLAREEEFAPIFDDCERGAEPPFGNLYGLQMIVDVDLTADEMVFNAGTHTETMKVPTIDYLGLVHPEKADLAL